MDTNRRKAPISRIQESMGHFRSDLGDHLTLLNVYNKCNEANFEKSWCESHCLNVRIMHQARNIRSYLQSNLESNFQIDRYTTQGGKLDSSSILRSLVTGYFLHAAHLGVNGVYETVLDGRKLKLHSTSVYFSGDISLQLPEWVIFHEIFHNKWFELEARTLSKVDPKWFIDFSGKYYSLRKDN